MRAVLASDLICATSSVSLLFLSHTLMSGGKHTSKIWLLILHFSVDILWWLKRLCCGHRSVDCGNKIGLFNVAISKLGLLDNTVESSVKNNVYIISLRIKEGFLAQLYQFPRSMGDRKILKMSSNSSTTCSMQTNKFWLVVFFRYELKTHTVYTLCIYSVLLQCAVW